MALTLIPTDHVREEEAMCEASEIVIDGLSAAAQVAGLSAEDRAFLFRTRQRFGRIGGVRLEPLPFDVVDGGGA